MIPSYQQSLFYQSYLVFFYTIVSFFILLSTLCVTSIVTITVLHCKYNYIIRIPSSNARATSACVMTHCVGMYGTNSLYKE